MKRKMAIGLSDTDKQPRISSFFSQKPSVQEKRPHSPIDLTTEDPGVGRQPPIKKLKVEKGNSLADHWRFDTTRKHSIERPVAGNEDDKKRCHEEFKRVLLAGNSSFARQKCHHGEQGAQPSEDESLQDQDKGSESDVSDEAFKNLTEIFSHKSSKVKSKTPFVSSAKSKGTSEALGPSGQPYTPAELQVSLIRCLHATFNNVLVRS